MTANDVHDIFISYRRDGAESLAILLHDRLVHAGYRVFLDVESLNSGQFNEALLHKIRTCTDVLVVLPPNALDRCVNENDWVRREIECALAHEKNIIPVLMRGFSFPETLPPSIAALPSFNGVTASSGELFDGVMLRLQNKLLRSKPQTRLSDADARLMQMYHRFQYLMSTPMEAWPDAVHAEADNLLEQMKTGYPARPEGYLCSLQYSYRLSSWEQLSAQTLDFTIDADWKFLQTIAPPNLKAKMASVLQASLDLRKKIAEEKAEKKRLNAERAQAAKARREEEQRQEAEKQKRARWLEAQPIWEQAVQICNYVLEQPPAYSQYDLLLEARDQLTSIQDVFQTADYIAACNKRLSALVSSAAAAARAGEEVIQCYATLRQSCFAHKKAKKGKDNTYTWIDDDAIPAGVVQAVGGQYRLLLLADGTLVPMNKDDKHTSTCQRVKYWEDVVSLFPVGFVLLGLQRKGTVCALNLLYTDRGYHTDGWTNVVSIAGSASAWTSSSSKELVLGLRHDGTVVTTGSDMFGYDVASWKDIASVHAFGPMLIGICKDGRTLVCHNSLAFWGRYEDMRKAVSEWTDCMDIAGSQDSGFITALRTDGTLLLYAQSERWDGQFYFPRKINDVLPEKGVCHMRVTKEGHILLLSLEGRLILYQDPANFSRHTLLDDVLSFACADSCCYALLRDGRVAEIDLDTLESQICSCEMTENAVRSGLNNWRRNAALQLLAQREKELRGPLMLGRRKEKCERSIRMLKELLGQQF